MLETISSILLVIIQAGTVITLIYALAKFLGKPNASQNERLASLEAWRKRVDKRLSEGTERFGAIEEGNRATQEALLALLDHAIDQNHTEQLINARDDLRSYLISK